MRGLLERICAEEGATVAPAVFPLVLRAGGGSARDSLSVLDQLLAGAGPEGVTYERAVALLGVTDVALIDDVVDASGRRRPGRGVRGRRPARRGRPRPAPLRRGPARSGCATSRWSRRSRTPASAGSSTSPRDEVERMVEQASRAGSGDAGALRRDPARRADRDARGHGAAAAAGAVVRADAAAGGVDVRARRCWSGWNGSSAGRPSRPHRCRTERPRPPLRPARTRRSRRRRGGRSSGRAGPSRRRRVGPTRPGAGPACGDGGRPGAGRSRRRTPRRSTPTARRPAPCSRPTPGSGRRAQHADLRAAVGASPAADLRPAADASTGSGREPRTGRGRGARITARHHRPRRGTPPPARLPVLRPAAADGPRRTGRDGASRPRPAPLADVPEGRGATAPRKPDTEPRAPQQPAAASLDAAAVRRVWSEILAAAKQRSRSTGALMVNATVRAVEGDVLVLTIGSRAAGPQAVGGAQHRRHRRRAARRARRPVAGPLRPRRRGSSAAPARGGTPRRPPSRSDRRVPRRPARRLPPADPPTTANRCRPSRLPRTRLPTTRRR